MNKVEEKAYAPRRLLNEQTQKAQLELRAKRNPERMRRIMPMQFMRRLLRGL